MFKFICLLLMVALATTVAGEEQLATYDATISTYSTALDPDNYINYNRQQHEKQLEELDQQMEIFRQRYTSSLNSISIKMEMLVNTLVQNEAKLNPLMILNDLSKKCVNKYSNSIPTITMTRNKVNACIKSASDRLISLLTEPLRTRTYLENYYKNDYEKNLVNCKNKYNSLPLNYTICVTSVTDQCDTYTAGSIKTFNTQMDTAQCSATANIKQALDCSYVYENDTITTIAAANTNISKCMEGQDDCKQCNSANTCPDVYNIKRADVNYNSGSIANPFYELKNVNDCMIMRII